MIFAPNVSIELDTETPSFPYPDLLFRWMKVGFDPGACQRILDDLAKDSIAPELLRPHAIARGDVVVSDRLLYPSEEDRWRLKFDILSESPAQRVPLHTTEIPLAPDNLVDVAEALRLGSRGTDVDEFREFCEDFGPTLLDRLVGPPRSVRQTWQRIDEPGVYRREHASVVIHSATTTILVDPIGMLRALSGTATVPSDPIPDLDAIFVTHGHGDHWHLPSILHNAPTCACPVIVPRVGRRNLLTRSDFETQLHCIGLAGGRAVDWGDVVTIGDITVDVLPFYGEQPTRDPPGPAPDVRSWGSCYRFNAPTFSAMLLVDSGADPMGDMVDVVRQSVSERGPVDVVLSCLREFASPFFGGLAPYWAPLPFARLQALYAEYQAGRLPNTTAGIVGTAEIGGAAQARYYLPYANGFNGVGTPIRDIGWSMNEPSEAEAMEKLSACLEARGLATRAVAWNPGDAAIFAPGDDLLVRRADGP